MNLNICFIFIPQLPYEKFEEIPALIEKLKSIQINLLTNISQQLISLHEDKIPVCFSKLTIIILYS